MKKQIKIVEFLLQEDTLRWYKSFELIEQNREWDKNKWITRNSEICR